MHFMIHVLTTHCLFLGMLLFLYRSDLILNFTVQQHIQLFIYTGFNTYQQVISAMLDDSAQISTPTFFPLKPQTTTQLELLLVITHSWLKISRIFPVFSISRLCSTHFSDTHVAFTRWPSKLQDIHGRNCTPADDN